MVQLLARFSPDLYVSSLAEIRPCHFIDQGIIGLILDLDNTIISWKSCEIDSGMVDLLQEYIEAGLRLCVVSNAFDRRVTDVLGPLGIPSVSRAKKPRIKPFLKAMHILGTEKDETAVVGDQLFTDVLGGRRLGVYTVLVKPISKYEFVGTRVVRIAEKILIRRMVKRSIIKMPLRRH